MTRFDPFAALGLPRRYPVDGDAVERAYLQRVAELHPDLLAADAIAGLGEDGFDAERRSSELNEAKRILVDPEQRAIALWRLLGGTEDKSLPPGFLEEIMGVREDMEATGAGGRSRWEAWIRERRGEFQRKVAELFGRIEAGESLATLLMEIRRELNAWRYIERMAEQIG
ncbi:MAG TPA: hypothetical protein VHC70_01175 [Phycisphaerales bacterium]|jgi:curved DNA-binding protein CbpA|nr:hypothetical protein [Phycisphaerales bacterium]